MRRYIIIFILSICYVKAFAQYVGNASIASLKYDGTFYTPGGIEYVGKKDGDIYRLHLRWDISSIPDGATITKVWLTTSPGFQASGHTLTVWESSINNLSTSDWDNMAKGSALKTLKGSDANSYMVNIVDGDLIDKIKSSLSKDFFAITMVSSSESVEGAYWYYSSASLKIDYTESSTDENTISCSNTTIAKGESPGTITGSDIPGPFKWKKKEGSGSWTDAGGNDTDKDYTPKALTTTTSYKRIANGVESKELTITVVENTICCSQPVEEGSSPGKLTGSSFPGPYKWKKKVDNGNWTDAGGADTDKDYSPGPITTPTYYKRIANGVESNTVTISINSYCTNGEQLLITNHDGWQISHGSPSYAYAKDFDDVPNNIGPVIVLEGDFTCRISNSYRNSDGVFIEYPFLKGNTYSVSLYAGVSGDETDNDVNVYAAHNIDAHPGNDKEVDTEAERRQLIGVADGFHNVNNLYQFTFVADEDYNSLWILAHYTDWHTWPPSKIYAAYWKISRVSVLAENLQVSKPFISPQTSSSLRGEKISMGGTDAIIANNEKLQLIADEQINLSNGFHAYNGSNFSAKIQDINNRCIENKSIIVSNLEQKLEKEEFEEDTIPDIVVEEPFSSSFNNHVSEGNNQEQVTKHNEEKTEGFISCAELKIFPNPSDGIFNIKIPSDFEARQIEILSSNGTVIYRNNINNNQLEMDIRDVKPGVYFIRLISNNNILTRRIIKK